MIDPPTVEELVRAVTATDEDAAASARDRQARLAKPPGSLGHLEELGARLAAIAGTSPPPAIEHPVLVLTAGDHGVGRHGVSPWPQDITRRVVEAVCVGAATCSVLAAQVGAEIVVVDIGVATPPQPHPRLRDHNVRRGTRDLMVERAMTHAEATAAVLAGARVAGNLIDASADLLITGEMGIANTTPAAALIAAYTSADPAQVTGRGTGINDETLTRKVEVVEKALARHGHDRDPLTVLASLGGLEHAALAGVILAGAASRVPVLLDGVSTTAAALAAVALCPQTAGYLIAGHRSTEPAAGAALTHLRLTPLIDLKMRLGEGTGGLLAVPLVQAAARILRDVATLEEL